MTFAFLAYFQSIFSSRISPKDCHKGDRTGIVNLKKNSGPFDLLGPKKRPRTGPINSTTIGYLGYPRLIFLNLAKSHI